jgi:hypothetical protein
MMDEKIVNLETAFERKVMRGLAAEWTVAAEGLDSPYDDLIRLPVFALRDMGTRLGQWHPERFEISLNRRLVSEHPWDAIREVLYHEMAHQLTDILPGGKDDPPHGTVFQDACRRLGATPRASGSYPTLHERLESGDMEKNDRLLLRIRKLLALAGSQNRHEAEAAMVKAHDLIRKYNIDRRRLSPDRDFTSIFLGKPALRHFREAYHLARLLQEYYFVEGVWVSAWVLQKNRMGRVLEISGTDANVKMAAYVFDFVLGFIDAEWHRYNRRRRLNRYRKTDFAVGVVEGFREKLALPREAKRPEQGRALVCAEDPLLTRYIRNRYPRIRSFHRPGGRQDAKVLAEGLRRGRKLVIARGIEEQGTRARPKLLPGRNKEA